jgi:hypothetical protein
MEKLGAALVSVQESQIKAAEFYNREVVGTEFVYPILIRE